MRAFCLLIWVLIFLNMTIPNVTSWFLRQAGGYWVDTHGDSYETPDHGQFAWDYYRNHFIGEFEQQGLGGEEAAAKADEQMKALFNDSKLQASNRMTEEGWIHIMADPSLLSISANRVSDIITQASGFIESLVDGFPVIHVAAKDLTVEVFIHSELIKTYGFAEALRRAIEKSQQSLSGLGPWIGRYLTSINYFNKNKHLI